MTLDFIDMLSLVLLLVIIVATSASLLTYLFNKPSFDGYLSMFEEAYKEDDTT